MRAVKQSRMQMLTMLLMLGSAVSGGSIGRERTDVVNNFHEMNLHEPLLGGIFAYGFEKPSELQQRVIMPSIKGRDVIVEAPTGTGKTAAFVIAILQKINSNLNHPQALILAPTGELAQQIQKVVIALGDYLDVKCHALIGGTSVRDDIGTLQSGVHIVVGSPEKVNDMINRGALLTNHISMFVMDQTDEMTSRGFRDQIYDIFRYLPSSTQVILLSATMPSDVLGMTNRFMRDPVKIVKKKEEVTPDGIKQFFVNVDREAFKLETLRDLFETLRIGKNVDNQAVIFTNTKRKLDLLAEKLNGKDFSVASIHGEMGQKERERNMREFRSGSSKVLISTGFLARGIDVQQVSLVVNYDLPHNRENYIHRIGRGGRSGRKGVAINFVTRNDMRNLGDIENFYKTSIEELPMDIADLI